MELAGTRVRVRVDPRWAASAAGRAKVGGE
jgi:hypothetical protein